jgi:arylformamidase
MNIIDITQPLFSCTVFPGDPAPAFERVKTIGGGNNYNLTNISLCVHNGTHIDSPRHFIADGYGVSDIPLALFHGKCTVKHWDGEIPENCERLLIKGSHELSAEDAKTLINSGVKLVGVESQSVGPSGSPLEVHLLLLGAGLIPLEGLVLSSIAPGEYTLSAFPLNLGSDCDGSPVRAVLIEN